MSRTTHSRPGIPLHAANRVPSYRSRKASGPAVVLNGLSICLGRFGTPESRAESDRVLAESLIDSTGVLPMLTGDWMILSSQDFAEVELYKLKADPKEEPDGWKRLSPNGGGPVKKK